MVEVFGATSTTPHRRVPPCPASRPRETDRGAESAAADTFKPFDQLRQLKNDLQSELNVERLTGANAGRVAGMDRATDQAIRRSIATAVVRLRQIQNVENIKHFDAELRFYALGDWRVLDHREIEGFEARAKELISLRIPEGSRRVAVSDGVTGGGRSTLLWKRTRIDPLDASLGPSSGLHDTAKGIAEQVSAILLVTSVAVVESGENAERETAVIGNETGKLPAFGQPRSRLAKLRYVINDRSAHIVTRVEI